MLSNVSWMENFQGELSSVGQSSPKEAWILVCSYVRGYFQQLGKVHDCVAISSKDSTAQTWSYIWAITQIHRMSQEFMSYQWCLHSSIAGIINYHIFKFMVSLSSHTTLKNKLATVRKLEKDRQVELAKLVTRVLKLESRKWNAVDSQVFLLKYIADNKNLNCSWVGEVSALVICDSFSVDAGDINSNAGRSSLMSISIVGVKDINSNVWWWWSRGRWRFFEVNWLSWLLSLKRRLERLELLIVTLWKMEILWGLLGV